MTRTRPAPRAATARPAYTPHIDNEAVNYGGAILDYQLIRDNGGTSVARLDSWCRVHDWPLASFDDQAVVYMARQFVARINPGWHIASLAWRSGENVNPAGPPGYIKRTAPGGDA